MQKQKKKRKKKPIPAICKCMVSMVTHNAIFKNGGVATKSFISHLLVSLDYKTWYQKKKLRHRPFITWSDIKISNLHIHEY